MQLSSEQLLPVAQPLAWEALNDIDMLKAAIPGCESITPTGDNEYAVALTAAIGPVKARFKGKLRLAEIVPPESYTIHFEGQGGTAGFGKGSATVKLEASGAHQTLLKYSANAQVGGKIAQIGSRLVDMAAQKMAGEFFSSFNSRLQEKYPPPVVAEPPAALTGKPGLWTRLTAWLRALFA